MRVTQRLTGDEVEAFLVFQAGLDLAGEKVQLSWRFVRLRSRKDQGYTKDGLGPHGKYNT